MIKAVIFDMDGVIVDSEGYQSKAFAEVIKLYGKKPIPNKNGIVHFMGATNNWVLLKEKYHINEEVDILKGKRREIYRKMLDTGLIKPMSGLYELLDLIKKNHLKIGLGTSSSLWEVEENFTNLKIKDYFDAVVTGNMVKKGKPDPEVYLLVAKKLKIDPQYCLVLEDTQVGVEAGHQAGMKVIAIPNKYTKGSDFSKANLIISSLKEINFDTILSL